AHAEKTGLKGKGEAETFEAWVAFCKQQGYPHPYPYPYPKPQAGARMRQIVDLVDKLLKDEKDEGRRKLLAQIRAAAAGALSANPQPPARKEEPEGEATPDGPAPDADGGVEKAGRKLSRARLTRLKKLLDELKSLIAEVDNAAEEKKANGETGGPEKLTEIEGTVAKIAKALGIAETKDGEDVPNLAEAVKDLKKRLEDLESTPAAKSSLDGQESLPGGGRRTGDSVWKNLL
ncbi:MAG: hypothetical protein ACYTKD_31790, partial [Planctomycetota bacterium]